MAEDEAQGGAEAAAKKGRMKPLLIGGVLMAVCGAGAFLAVSAGLVPGLGGGHEEVESVAEAAPEPHGDGGHAEAESVAFVAVDPLTITLGAGADRTHLRFASKLEVPYGRETEVAALMPRVVDVLGGYLRALDPAAIEERDAHARLRSQMLRRVRLVVGPEAVHDLLVTEFVVN